MSFTIKLRTFFKILDRTLLSEIRLSSIFSHSLSFYLLITFMAEKCLNFMKYKLYILSFVNHNYAIVSKNLLAKPRT